MGAVKNCMKFLLSAGVVVCASALGAGCVVVDSQGHIFRDEKRFTVTGRPDLQLTTFDGSIEIRTGDEKTVVVEIEKRGPTKEAVDSLQVDTKQDGNRIEVTVKKPAGETVFFGIGHMTPTARLIVTMPRDGNVVAKSGDGSIRADRVHGKLELRTGDGSIHATDVGGDLLLHSGDGSITLDSAEGTLDVDTGDGSVSVSGKLDAVKVHTGDGSVTLRIDSGSRMTDDWSITTGDGGVVVSLPQDFGAQLDANTGDGSIHAEMTVSTDGGDNNRRTLRGRLGSGGKLLRIRTGDGSIRLKTS